MVGQVCSGWGPVVWRFPMAVVPDGVSTEEQGSTSTLQLHNTSWRQAGHYACEEPSSRQTKSLDVFIPGSGKKKQKTAGTPSQLQQMCSVFPRV